MALERTAELRYTGLAQLKAEGGATVFDNASGERFVYNILMQALGRTPTSSVSHPAVAH